MQPIHYSLAREWLSRFDTPLRTLDALHLAVASSNNLRPRLTKGSLARLMLSEWEFSD